MGDNTAQARGTDASVEDDVPDPFADLADIFETEVDRLSASPHDDLGASFEHEFADALALDVARSLAASATPKPANGPQQSWVAPRAVRLADPMDDRGVYGTASMGAGQRSALTLQADLQQALRGLSSPANPRQPIIVETQSFAPDRVVEEPIEDVSASELDDFDELIASELAVMHRPEPRHAILPSAGAAARRPLPSGVDYTVAIEDGDPAGSYDEDPGEGQPRRRRRRFLSRSVVMLGGGVAALALVGAIGIALWSPGERSSLVASGDPLLIKADTTPFKMVPKEPGGRSIPNQNKAVYERVAAVPGQAAPQQQALFTDAEEPLELPAESEDTPGVFDDNLPGVELVDNEGLGLKDEDRVASAPVEAPDAALMPVLQPRKVRTMAVRPDGTLVPSEMPAAASAGTPEVPAVQVLAEPAPAPALIEVASAAPAPTLAPAVPAAPAMQPIDAAPEPAPEAAVESSSAPAPEAEPVEPVEPVAEAPAASPAPAADPIEVAAIAPAPAAPAPMPTGGYFVQISSQPSEALAQASLRSLGTRYSGVIGGRPIGIQPAEIPGKGTFYRVRVAAQSKSEAAGLCNRLKSAGGNCFVAR